MEEVVYYNDLYDLYGELLTEKQRKYFEDYYFQNYSYRELAEEYNISSNAIFNQIHVVLTKLEEYENKLKLLQKKNRLREISLMIDNKDIKEELDNFF